MELIYDTFVHYGPDIEHRPDPQRLSLGVNYQDIMPENGAQLHEDVLEALKTMFDKSGGLVAHDFKSDRRMLKDMSFSLVVQLQHDCNLICNASSTTTMSITGAEFATCTRQVIAAVHPCGVELSHECNLIRDVSNPGFTSITGAEFATRTRQLIAAVHPCGVELSVNFTFHALSNHVGTNSYHNAKRVGFFIACSRDESISSQVCEQMLVKVSLLDKTRAQKT